MAGVGLALAGVQREAAAESTRRPTPPSGVSAPASASPAPPAANVALTIEATTARGPWTMRVTNHGEVAVAIAADARLLVLDVTPRGARKPEHCELPSDMRPQDELQRPLVLPPGRTYTERFEPRLYCLDGRRLDALAPGSLVVASLGFGGHGAKSPLEVAPLMGTESLVAPSKAIVALPVALPDEPTATASPSAGPGGRADADAATTRLALRAPAALDAMTPDDIAIPVTLRNDGNRAVVLRFRPETLAFDVVGPAGSDHCDWPTLLSAPIREAFTTLAPRAEIALTVLLPAYCATRVLERAGLLVVRPSLDTRDGSGVDIGLRTFDGEVIATSATIVRLRHGALPEPLLRPTLTPQAPP